MKPLDRFHIILLAGGALLAVANAVVAIGHHNTSATLGWIAATSFALGGLTAQKSLHLAQKRIADLSRVLRVAGLSR